MALKRFSRPVAVEAIPQLPHHLIDLGESYAAGKIYHTLAGYMVRSKSEVIIANMLHEREIPFTYEVPLFAEDGTFYLPDFTVNSRFEEDPCDKMTLTLLLNHRAGFTHEAPMGNNYDASFTSFEDHVLSIQDTWLRFPVGERFSYSNLGIDLAGYVLQVVSGMPFHAYVQQHIFVGKIVLSTYQPEGCNNNIVS